MGKILKFKDGRKYTVTEETGKYFVCKGLNFRKADPDIESVVEEKQEEKKEEWKDVQLEEEPLKEEKKSAKTNRRKAKKGEE